MEKRIIYPNGDGGIAVIVPSPRWDKTIQALAKKDVPEGTPFLIVDAADIPTDRKYREAWEADFSNPDGYGGE